MVVERDVVAAPRMCNPYTSLPLAFPPPARVSLDTTVVEMTPTVWPASRPQAPQTSHRALALALEGTNDQRGDSLETPAKRDEGTKLRTSAVQRAKKQFRAVSAAAADNGSDALAKELQTQEAGPAKLGAPEDSRPNNVTATNDPLTTSTKRKRVAKTAPTPAAPIVIAPLERKCEGCIHCDLLELMIMEPTRIRYYLKPHEFLERAKCAGDCGLSIKEIFAAPKQSNLYYCDFGKKGYDAPEDDPEKGIMECKLVLCLACYGKREDAYAQANDGGAKQRRTRRRNNRN